MELIEEKLKLLEPVLKPAQLNYLRVQYIFENDYKKKNEIRGLIDFLIMKHVPGFVSESILLPPPEAKQLKGSYTIGNVLYPDKPIGSFGIKEKEWLKHVGIFGKTGSGKTTLTIKILKEICRHKKPFLIFDYKRNYRDLLGHPDFKNEDILIFTVGRNDVAPFYFNPKQAPDGIEEYVWVKQLMQLIEKVYFLGFGANDILMENASVSTFQAMQDKILSQKKKARELLWWASAKRTLNSINYPGLSEMVNCKQGHSIPDLLNKRVVLELDGLSGSDQAFVIGSLLLWIYHYRMRQTQREKLKHFIIIEEAHHLFLKTKAEEDIADVIMREIRELGEAMIIIDQHPSKLSVSALGNLSTKFVLSLSLNQDIMALYNSMLLKEDQRRYLSMLTIGKCICRSDRIIKPLLLSISNFPIKKGFIRDKHIREIMKPYLQNQSLNQPPILKKTNVQDIQITQSFSPLGKILLEHIAIYPFVGLVKRLKTLGFKVAQGYKIIDELTALAYIHPLTIDGNRLYELTVKGKQITKSVWKGRGGLEHRYYVEKIKRKYEQNNSIVYLEKDDMDLVVESDNKIIAIQVETGKSDIKGNIIKLENHNSFEKYMISTNQETQIKINQMIQKQNSINNIKVLFVKDFLKNL